MDHVPLLLKRRQ